MKKEDIIRKLTSRKLWLSVASFVSMLLVAQGRAQSEAAQVAALIMAGASVIGYALAEGLADASRTDDTFDQIDAIGFYTGDEDDFPEEDE